MNTKPECHHACNALWRGMKKTLIIAAGAWLAACGGSGGSEPPGPTTVPAGQSASQPLGGSGGTVVLNSSDGAVFTLDIPAGALPAGTVVGLATSEVRPGQHFNLRLTPAAAVLAAGLQATLTISLPASAAVPAQGGLLYAGVPIAFTRLADGRLQVLLSHFAAAAPRVATAGRAHALAADPTGAVCTPNLNADAEGLTAGDAIEIELYGQCMVASVNALAQNAEYVAAVRMASVTAAYLQATGLGDPAGFIVQASRIACIAYRDALNNALVTPVTTMGTLYAVLKPVLFWESTRQRLGATCANVGEGDFIEVTNAKTNEAATFYASKKGAIVDTTGVEYTEAAQEAKAGHDTIVQVRSLQPAPALNNVITVAIEQRAQPSLLDAILQAPWQRCRDSGDYTELLRLWELMDGPQPVKDAIQYCATQIGVQVRDKNDAVSAVLSPGLGGIRVDLRNTSGTLAVNRDSKIGLSGSIGALACPASDAEQLQIGFEGVEVATLASSGSVLLSVDRTLPALKASDLLRAAGLRDDDSGTHALVVKRRNSTCAAALGITDEVLATVVLDFGASSLEVTVRDLFTGHAAYNADGSEGASPVQKVITDRPSLPASISTEGCCGTFVSTMSLRQRDANTLEFGGEMDLSDAGWAREFAYVAVDFGVKFTKTGNVTVSINPAWLASIPSCNGSVSPPQDAVTSPWLRADISSIVPVSHYLALLAYACGRPDAYPASTSLAVTAGAEWFFSFQAQLNLPGHLSGTVPFTVHFEPTP
jgi:hypothetical protein